MSLRSFLAFSKSPASLSSLRLSQGFELLCSFPFAVFATISKISFQSFLSSSIFCQTISLRVSSVVRDLAVFPKFRFQCCLQGHRFVTRAHKYGELRRIPANFGELWRTLADDDDLANSGIYYFGF